MLRFTRRRVLGVLIGVLSAVALLLCHGQAQDVDLLFPFLILAGVRCLELFFFFSSRRRHTRFDCDWSSDVCSSDLREPTPEELSQLTGLSVDVVQSLAALNTGDVRLDAPMDPEGDRSLIERFVDRKSVV